MTKLCIFSSNKVCDDCGECDRCDLDSTKTCTNCGKCLESNDNEYKRVVIDEIDDEEGDLSEYISESEPNELDSTTEEGEESVEFIDDIDGLRDLLEIPENEVLEEIYPGLFTYKKSKEMH